jgi:5-methylcytosine-specific restriction enzyme A
VNVDDWANYVNGKKDPGRNPKYCYDWAFVEPGKVVVSNFWFELMQERKGVIWQDLDLRQDAADYQKLPHKSVWAKRAKKWTRQFRPL